MRIADGMELPKIELSITEYCNNRCGFCATGWYNHERHDRPFLPREEIRQSLQNAYDMGARRALFAGGEPTLHPALGEILQDALDVGYQATNVFTNGTTAIADRSLEALCALGVTWWQVSIQGGTAEAHDESVGRRGAFKQTVAGTRRLLEAGQRVKINGVLTRHLLDSLEPYADLMIDLAPEEVGLDTVKPSGAFGPGRASFADLVPMLSPYSTRLRTALDRMRDNGTHACLTSFPPCIVRGAEELVAEESNQSLCTINNDRSREFRLLPVVKSEWRSDMTVKAEGCSTCAYDATCPGLYSEYANIYGLSELAPIASRSERSTDSLGQGDGFRGSALPDVPLTRFLRELFKEAPAEFEVHGVNRMGDAHVLHCQSTVGELHVTLDEDFSAPHYRRAANFAVSYRVVGRGGDASTPQLRIVDAIVARIERQREALRALLGGG